MRLAPARSCSQTRVRPHPRRMGLVPVRPRHQKAARPPQGFSSNSVECTAIAAFWRPSCLASSFRCASSRSFLSQTSPIRSFQPSPRREERSVSSVPQGGEILPPSVVSHLCISFGAFRQPVTPVVNRTCCSPPQHTVPIRNLSAGISRRCYPRRPTPACDICYHPGGDTKMTPTRKPSL